LAAGQSKQGSRRDASVLPLQIITLFNRGSFLFFLFFPFSLFTPCLRGEALDLKVAAAQPQQERKNHPDVNQKANLILTTSSKTLDWAPVQEPHHRIFAMQSPIPEEH
jgi:hypothetical protein